MAINTYPKNSTEKLSANFKVAEFACKGTDCCKTVKIDIDLVAYLQKIRDRFGAPVTINSGYRCEKHNKAVGGASGSYHVKGMAADIAVKDVKPAEVAKYAESIGVKGIGLYETAKDGYFVHIDTRTSKSFWYGQSQAKRDTFGGAVSQTNNTVKAWQKAAIADGYKLASGADGIWGAECEAVAKKAICKKHTIGYKNQNLTKIVQAAVGTTVDGKFGNNTRDFVKAYQKRYGLTADGVVGYNTWKKILGVK
jgi:peptidoglycan hydrolase-like protein with peptidoglycan-binding domain